MAEELSARDSLHEDDGLYMPCLGEHVEGMHTLRTKTRRVQRAQIAA
jgi:hypothetical protein